MHMPQDMQRAASASASASVIGAPLSMRCAAGYQSSFKLSERMTAAAEDCAAPRPSRCAGNRLGHRAPLGNGHAHGIQHPRDQLRWLLRRESPAAPRAIRPTSAAPPLLPARNSSCAAFCRPIGKKDDADNPAATLRAKHRGRPRIRLAVRCPRPRMFPISASRTSGRNHGARNAIAHHAARPAARLQSR